MQNDERKLRILIVEDNDFLAFDLELTLSDHGHTTWIAADVQSALAHIADLEIDVSILDFSLDHGESVLVVADQLMKKKIPFVFLTGRSKSSLPPRFSGVPLLSKPYDVGDLLRVLRSRVRPG